MSTITDPTTEQLIAELYKVEGKAEIVDGRIVRMSPTGIEPGSAAGAICVSLRALCKKSGRLASPMPTMLAFLYRPAASKVVLPRRGLLHRARARG